MPSLFPCPEFLRDCDCEDFPVRNFSQELPDAPVFIGTYNTPAVTGTYFAPGCLAICESTISQEAADDCAAAQAAECSFDGTPTVGNPIPGGGPTAPRFGNTLQECDSACPDGNFTTVVVPANSVISSTQADADARAHGLACKRADELKVCFVTTSPLTPIHADEFASIPIVAVGGNGDYEFVLVSGVLPTGMTLDAVGLISGTPTSSGTATFGITVTDTGGASSTKTFSLEVLTACGVLTNWCDTPGTCRLRIQNFDSGDWVAGTFPPPFQSNPCDVTFLLGWDGSFPFTKQNGLNPCLTYKAVSELAVNPSCDIDYNGFDDRWEMAFNTPSGTMAFFIGPSGLSPLGTYTKDPNFSCTGPNSFVLEPYTP